MSNLGLNRSHLFGLKFVAGKSEGQRRLETKILCTDECQGRNMTDLNPNADLCSTLDEAW